jgi:hypothetical protein
LEPYYQRLATGPVGVVGHLHNGRRCNRESRNLGPIARSATYGDSVCQIWRQVTVVIKSSAHFLTVMAACEHHLLPPSTTLRFLRPLSPPILHQVTRSRARSDRLIWGNDIGIFNTSILPRIVSRNFAEDLYLISSGPLRQPLR